MRSRGKPHVHRTKIASVAACWTPPGKARPADLVDAWRFDCAACMVSSWAWPNHAMAVHEANLHAAQTIHKIALADYLATRATDTSHTT